MNIGRTHQVSMALVAVLSAVGVMSGSQMLLLSGLSLCLCVFYGVARLHRRENSKIALVLVHGLTLAGLVFAVSVFRTSRIDSVLFVLMLGVFNRVLLRMGRRDDFFVLVSSAILFAAATTVTPGFEFALLIFFFVPALLMAMWMTTIVGMAETSVDESAYDTILRLPTPQGLRRLGMAGLLFTMLGFSAVSILPRFTFLPMLGAGAFANFGGVSQSMSLGTGGVSQEGGTAVVLRVQNLKEESRDQLPGLYARMYALDSFDGKNWSSSRTPAIFRLNPRNNATEKQVQPLKVTVKRSGRSGLVAVPQIGRQFGARVHQSRIFESLNGNWTMGPVKGMEFELEVDLATPTTTAAIPVGHQVSQEKRLLRLPTDFDPRIGQLGKELTAQSVTVREKVRAVLAHFDRGFEYSLDPIEGDEKSPLARFLFEAKKGHCELYAGAVAVLLRSVGIRTRIATGYYGGRYNDLGGYLGFTGNDAHAWVEVWIPNEGWRWFDATPEEQRWRRSTQSFFTKLSDFYDALNRLWYDNVVDYESEHDVVSLATSFARFTRKNLPQKTLEGAFFDSPKKESGLLVYYVVLVLFAVGLAGLIISRRRRYRLSYLGHRLRGVLGGGRKTSASLEELLFASPYETDQRVRQLIQVYQELRFGAPLSPGEYRARCRTLEHDLRELKQSPENE